MPDACRRQRKCSLLRLGWVERAPAAVRASRQSFRSVLGGGLPICMGDVGVFAHGTNVCELELMVAAGMMPAQTLVAATSGNVRWMRVGNRLGSVRLSMLADPVSVADDPTIDVSAARAVRTVLKNRAIIAL